MANKLDVSFNSPQCGWMSIGFDDGAHEFHTTTAHSPHEQALPELLGILSALLQETGDGQYFLKWNRDPEEFDFNFRKTGEELLLEIFQYPSEERDAAERERVFVHRGYVREVCRSFHETFTQLYADRETDEFQFNWRQPFPFEEYRRFSMLVDAQGA